MKKKLKKKKAVNTAPKKWHGHWHCLSRWPAGAKKKIGVEQEKVCHVRHENA
jgi:hypothetical protein